MKILVLGGGGFIGINLTKALLKDGFDVRVFEHPNNNSRNLFGDSINLEWIMGDFTNPQHVKGAIDGCEIVFHLVSTTLPANSNKNPVYDTQSNVVSSVHMINAAKEAGVKKIIFASSGGTVYGIPQELPISESHPTNPICSYGISKLAIEKHLLVSKLNGGPDYSILRLANPYGLHQSVKNAQGVVPAIINNALNREVFVVWGDGKNVRDFVYIDDVVDAFLRSMQVPKPGPYNIGSGDGCSVCELIAMVGDILNCTIKTKFEPSRHVDVPVNLLNITKATSDLSWEPTVKLRGGLAKTIGYFRSKFEASV